MNSKTTYYIFRHGQTFVTKEGRRTYGLRFWSADILPEASPAIERMGKYLSLIPTEFHISSDMKRCRSTVAIINSLSGKEFVFDKRLRDYFFETVSHLQRRVKAVVDEIEAKEYKAVCICTHGANISVLMHLLAPDSEKKPFSLSNFPHPGILTIIENGKIKQIDFNKEGPLSSSV